MKDLTTWANRVIDTSHRPKFTQRNMEILKEGKKRKIIGFHGSLQSGKDTSGKVLIGLGFKRVAFADALRDALYVLNPNVESFVRNLRVQDIVNANGWDTAKTKYPEIRRLLQVLGTEAGRDIHGQNCWTDIVASQFEQYLKQDFVITDVRFPNEVQLIHDYDGIVIRVVREGTAPSEAHASEQLLENCDHVIENNGTLEELKEKVLGIVFPRD